MYLYGHLLRRQQPILNLKFIYTTLAITDTERPNNKMNTDAASGNFSVIKKTTLFGVHLHRIFALMQLYKIKQKN